MMGTTFKSLMVMGRSWDILERAINWRWATQLSTSPATQRLFMFCSTQIGVVQGVDGVLNGVSASYRQVQSPKILISGLSSLVDREQTLSGFMTSPNYPKPYPNDLDIVHKIEVPAGKRIWIRFSDFHLCHTEWQIKICNDTLTLIDQDGTQLEVEEGHEIVSRSNKVKIHFHTDTTVEFSRRWHNGWSLNWGE